MSSIKCLNFEFLQSKIMPKNFEFMDQIVNKIRLERNFTCTLKTYNSIVRFSKYITMLIV